MYRKTHMQLKSLVNDMGKNTDIGTSEIWLTSQLWWSIFRSNFCVSEKRDRKWIEGFEVEFFRFC